MSFKFLQHERKKTTEQLRFGNGEDGHCIWFATNAMHKLTLECSVKFALIHLYEFGVTV